MVEHNGVVPVPLTRMGIDTAGEPREQTLEHPERSQNRSGPRDCPYHQSGTQSS